MNLAHLHLLLNHFPIVGLIVTGCFLLGGHIFRSISTVRLSLAAGFLLSLVSIAVYFTGEPAAENLENGIGAEESSIEAHENFALLAFMCMLAFGAVCLFAWIASLRNLSIAKPAAMVALIFCLFSIGMMVRTGLLGGRIRHTEFSNTPTSPQPGNVDKDQD